MNKAFLVALREYMENLKTKTFWIGIMIFPVILVLSFLVPMWLEKSKDVRHYAVIDNSGWLLEAVEKRAAMPDMEKVFEEAVQRYRSQSEDFEELPDILKILIPGLVKGIDEHVHSELGEAPGPDAEQEERQRYKESREHIEREDIQDLAEQITRFKGPEGEATIKRTAQFIPELSEVNPAEVISEFDKQFIDPIKNWWQGLPPKEAQKYGSGLAKSRYARIDVDVSDPEPEKKLNEMLNQEKLFAYFVVGVDPVGKAGSSAVGGKYVSNNLTDTDLKNWFSRLANAVVSEKRIDKANISEADAKWIQAPLEFEAKQVSAAGEEEEAKLKDKARQWAPVAFVYLLWISVFMIAQMLLTNTIEEKSNKIMEVLLSSVSPIQLMAGKIVGIAGTGLTMVLSWVIFFLLGIKLMPYLLPKMPDIDFALIARDPIYLSSFVAYFLLGYLFLASILVGIGSVCNSLKEAQNLMGPVTIIMIIPLMAMIPIGQDPNGTIAKVLSYVPPFTPFVMMNRAAGPPSSMEYLFTTILLLISIAFTLWAAAKVFRVGILMTGKPPKFLEILRWIRAPVGHVQVRKEEE
jgi:ABC-type Na+ efflux pump permease subunit